MQPLSRTFQYCCFAMSVALLAGSGMPAAAAVQFFSNPNFDRTQFHTSCRVLPLEDFEDTNVPLNTNSVCSTALNSSTNDPCYSPGALIGDYTGVARGRGARV